MIARLEPLTSVSIVFWSASSCAPPASSCTLEAVKVLLDEPVNKMVELELPTVPSCNEAEFHDDDDEPEKVAVPKICAVPAV